MFRRLHLLAALLAAGVTASAAPMTLKELDFLIRQRTPENEIVQLATQRRLVLPITPDFERNLRQSGATDSLLARLKAPGLSLSPEEMRVEAARAMANQARAQQAIEAVDVANAEIQQRKQEAAAVNRRGGTMCRILNGGLAPLVSARGAMGLPASAASRSIRKNSSSTAPTGVMPISVKFFIMLSSALRGSA